MADQEVAMKKEDIESLVASLPRDESGNPLGLRNYKGFWYPEALLPTIISSRQQYVPRDTDVLLVCPPKCGTTWLKALGFATVNRNQYRPSSPHHPLLSKHPQECVPYVEMTTDFSQLESIPPPRIFGSHMAYSLLPQTTASSGCRVVFLCRDPKDQLVSQSYFLKQFQQEEDGAEMVSLHRMWEMFCKGVNGGGPIWDLVLPYWRASLERPSKVLFLKYEDLQQDAAGSLRRLAEFLGCPFTEDEEKEGVVEDIVRLCSFDNLSGLEANKNDANFVPGTVPVKKKAFFRKGKVGDWKNHLTVEMAAKMDAIIQEKLAGSGLSLGSTSSDSYQV